MSGETIPIIINPSSGRPQPILHILSRIFRAHSLAWNALITYGPGDARRFAEQAVADGAELIVCCGGDGTLKEIVNGVIGSPACLGILPCGTGNSVARILGIPLDLAEAVELICTKPNRKTVSVGCVDQHYFILRAHTGITQEQSATRQLKDTHHLIAYAASALRFVGETPEARFRIWRDGKETQVTALACIVNNLGGFGEIHPSLISTGSADGVFDILFVSKNLEALAEFSSYLLDLGDPKIRAHHFTSKEITLMADPPQPVWTDGEYFGQTPVTFRALPDAVTIIVP